MIEIDGSFGEGGGQILRTSLALSTITGEPLRLFNIRANRKRGGLQPQHLTCVTAAAEVASADLSGAKIDSRELTFRPRKPQPGDYTFDIGTAGSTSLVFQTILPALLRLKEPSTVTITGGTHNDHAPPFDFLEQTFLPLLNRLGPKVTATLERPGFYPVGRGVVRYVIQPAKHLGRLDLLRRGPVREVRVRAVVSRLNRNIAEREVRTAQFILTEREKPLSRKAERRKSMQGGRVVPRPESTDCLPGEIPDIPDPILEIVQEQRALSPGNCVLIFVASGELTEVFSAVGARGVPAEQVATAAAMEARDYLRSDVSVGPHLADQLLLPLALGAGGSYLTGEPTLHARTNVEVIRRFLDVPLRMTEFDGKRTLVQVGDVPAEAPPGDATPHGFAGERAGENGIESLISSPQRGVTR